MEAWKVVRTAKDVTMRTSRDSKIATRDAADVKRMNEEMDDRLEKAGDRRMVTLSNGYEAEEFAIIDLLYADDTCLPFLSRDDLEKDLIAFRRLCTRFGLKIHVRAPGQAKKSKALAVGVLVSKRDEASIDMSDIDAGNGDTIHRAPSGKYLGSMIAQDGESGVDIDNRISCGWAAFAKLENVLTRAEVEMQTRRVLYEATVLNVVLYGCESWTLKEEHKRKLRSFHRACARKMCRISMWHVKEYGITTRSTLRK